MTYETTICRDATINGNDVEVEIPIEVEFSYHKAIRGSRDRYGVPMEPDEDASIEIESVTDLDSGSEIALTKQEEEWIEEKCIEHAEDSRW